MTHFRKLSARTGARRFHWIARSGQIAQLAKIATLLLISGGCGGTTIGNPVITLESAAYRDSTLARTADISPLAYGNTLPNSYVSISDFRFCVTKIKLKNSNGGFVKKNGSESIEAGLGLINISDTTSPQAWGQVNVPAGFLMSELKIELHRDPEICSGADFSVSFNGQSIRKDLEFKFKFDPPVAVDGGGETFQLNPANIAAAFGLAQAASSLNDEQISNFITETLSGTGIRR